MRWALHHLPFYGRWFRFLIFWPSVATAASRAPGSTRTGPTSSARSAQRNEMTRQMFTQWIESQVGDDPELLAKVIPDYPATGKRTLQDNGSWLTRAQARQRRARPRRDRPHRRDGVVTVTGERYDADIIVYATGFYTNRALWPMQITSRGQNLGQLWGESPSAYLGITCRAFPNLFCMYGPGTNLAHGGSLIFHSECQMRYITGCLNALIAGDHTVDGAAPGRARRVLRAHPEGAQTLVWAQPSIKHSHFKNPEGKIHSLSPWRLVDYWTWTRRPDLADFVVSSVVQQRSGAVWHDLSERDRQPGTLRRRRLLRQRSVPESTRALRRDAPVHRDPVSGLWGIATYELVEYASTHPADLQQCQRFPAVHRRASTT